MKKPSQALKIIINKRNDKKLQIINFLSCAFNFEQMPNNFALMDTMWIKWDGQLGTIHMQKWHLQKNSTGVCVYIYIYIYGKWVAQNNSLMSDY